MARKKNDGWREPLIAMCGRFGLVLLVVLALLLISIFPLPLGTMGDIRPAFIVMVLYYWGITRPAILTLAVTLATGIAYDLLTAHPLGMNAAIFVLVYWTTRSQRKFLMGQSFLVVWAGLAMVVSCVSSLQWMLYSLFNMAMVNPFPVIVGAVFTIALFPLAVPVLSVFGKWVETRASSLA